MRIVVLDHDGPNWCGGPIVNMLRLLPELKRRGHQPIMLLLAHGEAPNSQRFQDSGIECRVLEWQIYNEIHIKWILQQISELDPDVFVPNTVCSGYFAARWVRESGIPTIAALRSDDAYHWGMVRQFVVGSHAWAVSGLVCVSRGLHDVVNAMRPAHTQLCVIPSGVPIPTECSDQDGALRIAYVGRLEQKQKRILDVVIGMCSVLKKVDRTTATIFGSGSEQQAIKQIISSNGLDHRIFLRGVVSQECIQNELIKHDIIVLFSDYEGTPGALMDGMACGLVPICTDIPGGVRDLVKNSDTGLIVQNRDDAFVSAVDKLNTMPTLRKSLAVAARQHVIRNYSLDVCACRWEAFCSELIASRGQRRKIIMPSRFELPPVHPDLASEDYRRPRGLCLMLKQGRQFVSVVKTVLYNFTRPY